MQTLWDQKDLYHATFRGSTIHRSILTAVEFICSVVTVRKIITHPANRDAAQFTTINALELCEVTLEGSCKGVMGEGGGGGSSPQNNLASHLKRSTMSLHHRQEHYYDCNTAFEKQFN